MRSLYFCARLLNVLHADEQHMSNNKSLKTQLKEMEELVAALTERLELAAEQLDRFQRSGADRGMRSGGGGFPPELIEKHESLIDELHQAVQQWNDMQAGTALGNLEMQVSELRDLVSSESNGDGQPARQDRLSRTDDAASERPSDEVVARGDEEPASGQEDRWDALKSYLLESDDAANDEQAETTIQPAVEKAGDTGHAQNECGDSEPPAAAPLETADPPLPVDADEADVTVLRTAIEARDEYIGFLISKLRNANSHARLPSQWAEWESIPEELCRQVEELQSELTETLRMSELEHSLERARLGREEARIRQMEETVRKTLRQLGLDPDLDNDEEIALERERERDAGTGNRWLRMLGICRDDDDEDDDDE